MLKSIRIKKVEVVRNFAIIAMMVLVRFIAASSRTCVHSVPPKKACTEYTTRAFLHRVGITKPAVSVQCTKRNTSTTPLEHWTDISISELKAMLSSNNIQLFDVREPYELVEMGKIACATNIPLRKVPEAFTMDPDEFEEQYNVKMPKKNDINIVFHCLAGVRSRAAMEAVHQIGYTKFEGKFKKRISGNLSNPLGAQNKDIVTASQTLLTGVRLHLQGRLIRARHYPGGFEEWAKLHNSERSKA